MPCPSEPCKSASVIKSATRLASSAGMPTALKALAMNSLCALAVTLEFILASG